MLLLLPIRLRAWHQRKENVYKVDSLEKPCCNVQNTNSDSQISPARVQYSPTTFTAAFTASFVKRLQWKRDTHNKADWRCNSVNCYFVITQQYIVCILNSWFFCCSRNTVLVFYWLKMLHGTFGRNSLIAYKSCYLKSDLLLLLTQMTMSLKNRRTAVQGGYRVG